jgi:hypothetical protein
MFDMDPNMYKSTITYKIHTKQLFYQTYVNQLYLTYVKQLFVTSPKHQKNILTQRPYAPAGLGHLEFCPSGHEPRVKKVFYI